MTILFIAMTFFGVDPEFCVRGDEILQGVWGPFDVPSGSRAEPWYGKRGAILKHIIKYVIDIISQIKYQEVHEPHRSPEKPVQINKHIIMIIIMLIKRRKNPLFTL